MREWNIECGFVRFDKETADVIDFQMDIIKAFRMQKSALDKIQKIQELLKQKEEIERQLEQLVSPEKVVSLPPDFSLTDEVSKVIKTYPNGVDNRQITHILNSQFPNHGINRKKVNATLMYLKNKKKEIEKVSRGLYIVKKQTPQNQNQETQIQA